MHYCIDLSGDAMPNKFSKTMAVFGCVKAFPENFLFSGNAIFRKGKCIQENV